MRILFCGDVVGRSGRKAIHTWVPRLKKELKLDCIIVNGENAASGFGVTRKICQGFFDDGVNAITCGDHSFDQNEMMLAIDDYPNVLRPLNFPKVLPGAGSCILNINGKRVAVLHLLGQLFLRFQVSSPFEAVEEWLHHHKLRQNVDAIIVDFHAEATSEAMGMGHYLDGKVSLVTGSHTHVPTADAQILPGGTAYQTDAGMCGDYDSVIGFSKQISITTFFRQIRTEKMVPANEEGTLCGTYVEIDDNTGLATRVEMVRVGGRLSKSVPIVK